MGPTIEEALVGTHHWLHLDLEGVSYLESVILSLIDGVTRGFVIAPLAVAMGASFSSAH